MRSSNFDGRATVTQNNSEVFCSISNTYNGKLKNIKLVLDLITIRFNKFGETQKGLQVVGKLIKNWLVGGGTNYRILHRLLFRKNGTARKSSNTH